MAQPTEPGKQKGQKQACVQPQAECGARDRGGSWGVWNWANEASRSSLDSKASLSLWPLMEKVMHSSGRLLRPTHRTLLPSRLRTELCVCLYSKEKLDRVVLGFAGVLDL